MRVAMPTQLALEMTFRQYLYMSIGADRLT